MRAGGEEPAGGRRLLLQRHLTAFDQQPAAAARRTGQMRDGTSGKRLVDDSGNRDSWHYLSAHRLC